MVLETDILALYILSVMMLPTSACVLIITGYGYILTILNREPGVKFNNKLKGEQK